MKYKLVAAVLLSSLIMTGCITTLEDIPAGEFPIHLNSSKKVYTFKQPTDVRNKLTESDVLRALEREFSNNAPFSRCSQYCEQRHSAEVNDFWGRNVVVDKGKNVFELKLAKGQRFRSGRVDSTNQIFRFPYTILNNDSVLIVEVTPAENVIVQPGSNIFGVNFSKLLDDKGITKYVSSMLEDAKPEIEMRRTRTGEFDVEFDPASVKTNFTRLLSKREVNRTNDTKYSESYSYREEGVYAEVDLNIFLYRGKSKVEYLVRVPYVIKSDGVSTEPTDEVMNNVINRIKSIANN